VLSSGGARGAAHVGVLRALENGGFSIDVIAGTSVGAGVGGLYAAGVSVERIEKLWLGTDLKRVIREYFPTLPRSGWSRGDELIRSLSDLVGESRIEDLKIPFAAVATDINTGEEIILREGPLVEAIRASTSIPALFTPVCWKGRYLVDGGLVNPVPVSLARLLGAEVVIAVDVAAQPLEGFTEEPSMASRFLQFPFDNKVTQFFKSRLRDAAEETVRTNAKTKNQSAPSLISIVMQSSSILQRQLISHRMERERPDLLITPKFAQVPRYWRAVEAIQAGEDAMQTMLPALKTLVASR
jgi:NTE family protein